MIKKTLGNSGVAVTPVGLGTVKFGRNQGVKYPSHFELPTDDAIVNLLSLTKELGINLIDTAPAYGISEERLGHLLKGHRSNWVLCTKAGEEFTDGKSHFDFSEKWIRHSVERSLKRLQTDYLDIVIIHSNGDDVKLIDEFHVLDTLNTLKKEGLIRASGMSTKTIEGGIKAIDHSDVVMVAFNPVQTEERPVIAHAYQKNKSVFIKKALSSGHLNQISSQHPVDSAMKFIFSEPGVTSVILGTINPDHLRHNVESILRNLSGKH